MRYTNYLGFSIFHIKLFLSLCENLNYTKAAEECCVTQPTLSRTIKQLETTLGIQLFIRNTVRVTMTPAGKSLYKDMKRLYGEMESAILNAYRIQKGRNSLLTLGICDGMNITAEVLSFWEPFHRDHPNFEINMARDYNFLLLDKLRSQECDIIFDFWLKDKDDPFIASEQLFTGPLMLYMLPTNPLLEKAVLTLSDLRSQRLLIRSPSTDSNHAELIHKMYAQIGVEPRFAPYVANALDLSLNINEDNEGILADGYYVDRYCPYLEARPIENTQSTVWVRWVRGKDQNSDKDLFVREMLEFFRDRQKQQDSPASDGPAKR